MGQMSLEAVFFDAVGALISPRPSVGRAYARVASRHGIAADPGALRRGFAAAWRQQAPARFGPPPDYLTDDRREKNWWRQTVALTFRNAGVPEPDEECFEDIFASFAEPGAWRVFDDAPPALEALRRRGLRVGIVSNFDSRLHAICRGLGLERLVDFVLPSAQVGHAKPSRQIFRAALARAGAAPDEALMVGDSRSDDPDGARAAGLHALLLDRKARHSGPAVVRSVALLPPRLFLP